MPPDRVGTAPLPRARVDRRLRFDNPRLLRINGSMHPPAKVFLLAFVSAVCTVHAQTTPAKLATSARLDLIAEPGVLALADAEIPSGTGAVGGMNRVPEAEPPRSYTVHYRLP